ncbi:M56 family metallopeptidase [Algoriphagus sp. CAU 1675]|uniref:M56 family metallopeptidase n=1 Tax=Algoriphagus sp. CAU 1675 TaxID=3032597 RepID=UPI0023DBBFC3|nr:M56 family metallopeptidase [Algoriphagus sp. CAU 1675]MDF2156838.1 M56 family metallopeptidase [Algoriphagus sp. CAU 1675]
MNLLNDWIPENLLQALGWTLVHSIWQLILVSGLLWLVLKLFSKKSPGFKYWLSTGALAIGFLASVSTFFYELSLLSSYEPGVIIQEEILVFQGVGSEPIFTENSLSLLVNWIELRLPLLVNFWFVGAMLFLFRLFNSLSEIRSLKKTSQISEDPSLDKTLNRLAEKLGITRKIELRLTSNGLSAITFGFLKPVVLIPAGLIFQLSQSQLEAIIAHELAHIKRNDYLINIIQSSLEVLFFYHPCFWWMSKTVKELRENAADDLAIRAGVEPKVLAYSLAELINFAKQNPPELALAAAKRRNPTLNRIKRILGFPSQIYPQNPIISIPMLLTLILSAGLMASAQQDAPLIAEAILPEVYLENPDLGYLEPIQKKAPVKDSLVSDTTIQDKKVVKVDASSPMIWTTKEGQTFVLRGDGNNKFEYRIKGDTLISGKDTLILKGNSAMVFRNGIDMDLSTMPRLELADAPEFPGNVAILEAPAMDFEIPEFPDMPEMALAPIMEMDEFPMVMVFRGDFPVIMDFQDTTKMTETERKKWKKEQEERVKEWAQQNEKRAEEWAKVAEEQAKEWAKKSEEWAAQWKENEAEREAKIAAWKKDMEPKMKEWEEKMKDWQKEQEPKFREFEKKMKEWEKSQQPKIEEFQKKMAEWQKENADKMKELQEMIQQELKKNQNEKQNNN